MANVYYAIESSFDNEGYHDLPHQVSAEKLTPSSHEPLFNFLRHDLSALDKAMYGLLGLLDTDTLEIDEKNKEKKLQKVYDTLKEVHPYYRCGATASFEVNKAVRLCLNLLLYDKGYSGDRLLSKDKYIEILGGLSSRDFKYYDTEYLDGLYDEYTEFNPLDVDYETDETGHTFPKILDAKRNAQMMLFWIFDFSVPELAHLTVYQRAYLYDSVFNGEFSPVLEVKKNVNFNASDRLHEAAFLDFRDEDDMAAVFHLHNNSYSSDSDNNIPFPAVMNDIMAGVQKITGSPVREICEIDSLEQLLSLELVDMLDQNIIVKRCKYCGNYFIAENLKNEYCTGYAPNEKRPCSEIGSARAYQNKVKKDEVQALFQRSYKTHHARVKKGKMTNAEFYTWTIEAKQKTADVREGALEMEEYAEWLKI